MGAYISMSSEVGARALIGAWALKGTNTVPEGAYVLPGPVHEIIMSLLKLLTDRRKQTVNVVKKTN